MKQICDMYKGNYHILKRAWNLVGDMLVLCIIKQLPDLILCSRYIIKVPRRKKSYVPRNRTQLCTWRNLINPTGRNKKNWCSYTYIQNLSRVPQQLATQNLLSTQKRALKSKYTSGTHFLHNLASQKLMAYHHLNSSIFSILVVKIIMYPKFLRFDQAYLLSLKRNISLVCKMIPKVITYYMHYMHICISNLNFYK